MKFRKNLILYPLILSFSRREKGRSDYIVVIDIQARD
jgi:hypothetical protein